MVRGWVGVGRRSFFLAIISSVWQKNFFNGEGWTSVSETLVHYIFMLKFTILQIALSYSIVWSYFFKICFFFFFFRVLSWIIVLGIFWNRPVSQNNPMIITGKTPIVRTDKISNLTASTDYRFSLPKLFPIYAGHIYIRFLKWIPNLWENFFL